MRDAVQFDFAEDRFVAIENEVCAIDVRPGLFALDSIRSEPLVERSPTHIQRSQVLLWMVFYFKINRGMSENVGKAGKSEADHLMR